MWWKLSVFAILLIAGVLVWLGLEASTIMLGDGAFELTVNVSSTPGPPRSVECHACGRREQAAFVLEHGEQTRTWSTIADPFTGGPLIVYVPVTTRSSRFRQLSRSQFQWLVVIAELPDGRRVGKMVEIPDGRVSHEIRVDLP
jgi:hypothetical protein